MSGSGYCGTALFVDLSVGQCTEETISETAYRDFLGGFGLGVRFLYERMQPGADPLGPGNMLGFVSGPLTGTGAISSGRWTVVAKSPLTGGWGDSNCGAKFGVNMRRSGYDAIFLTGMADHPVYLFVDDGKAEIRDAGHLWGADTYETERAIKAELGGKVEVACIGQSGEKLSLISCIITDMGRAAGRSGLGAVMGSKNLKAIAVTGKQKVHVSDRDGLNQLNKTMKEALDRKPPGYVKVMGKVIMPLLPFIARRKISLPTPPEVLTDMFRTYGTCASTAGSAAMQDSPIKNWKGNQKDFPLSAASNLSDEAVIKYEKTKYGCFGCPVKCGGIIEQKSGPYALKEESHKPEYETLSSFGSMCLNKDLKSIILANDICNRYGLDTISAGATVAFAIECYVEGSITRDDTGIELKWGDPEGILAILKMMADREGFGDILADGVKAAASRIGNGADGYAMHVGGQELPMHDPRLSPGVGLAYVVDPTPGRHTVGSSFMAELGLKTENFTVPKVDKHDYARKGESHVPFANFMNVVTCAGLCNLPIGMMKRYPLVELLNAATGWAMSSDDYMKAGERIQMLRHCFNLREGLQPADFRLPPRAKGMPPQTYGPLKGVTLDDDAMARSCLREMGMDEVSGEPSPEKLRQLGLDDLVKL